MRGERTEGIRLRRDRAEVAVPASGDDCCVADALRSREVPRKVLTSVTAREGARTRVSSSSFAARRDRSSKDICRPSRASWDSSPSVRRDRSNNVDALSKVCSSSSSERRNRDNSSDDFLPALEAVVVALDSIGVCGAVV